MIRGRNVTGINSLTRMMIENFVFFSTIDDSKQKYLIAKRYIISCEMNTCKKHLEVLGRKESLIKNKELTTEYEFWYGEWEKYKPIKLTKNGKKPKLEWHGERNFKELCEKKDFICLEDSEIYEFYKLFSIEVHNLNPSLAINNESSDYDYSQKEMVISIISLINWMMFIVVKRATKYIDFDLKSLTKFNDTQVKTYVYRKHYGISPFNTVVYDGVNDKFKRVYKK